MFKREGTLTHVADWSQAVGRFIRKLQTDVEHTRVTNATLAAFVKGNVLALGAGDRQAELADASGGQGVNPEWVGIASEPTAVGVQGVMRTNGRAPVLFEPGLAPASGELAFVSFTTPGLATNVVPVVPGTFYSPIGRIVDVSAYNIATGGLCDVLLGQCCNAESQL